MVLPRITQSWLVGHETAVSSEKRGSRSETDQTCAALVLSGAATLLLPELGELLRQDDTVTASNRTSR